MPETDDDDVKMFTTRQVAEFCEVTEETVRNWIKKGALKAIRLPGGGNGRLRVPKNEVKKFIDARYGDN